MVQQTIKLKRSNVSGKIPSSENLEIGEIALNMADSLLFYKEPSGEVKSLNVSNVLNLDNNVEYLPTGEYNPATKAYVDLNILQNLVGLTTIERTEIVNNEIILPKIALGDIMLNMAMVYDNIDTNVFQEVTCTLSEDKSRVLFDPLDDIDYKYCILSYLTFQNQ